MGPFEIFLLIVGIVLVLSIGFGIFSVPFAAYQVYSHTLMRKKGKNWGRQISEAGNEDLQKMWDEGVNWAKNNVEFKKDVSITSFDGR